MSSTEIRGRAAQYSNVASAADGFPVDARALRDGTLGNVPWKMLKVMEGYGYHVSIGAFSTPIVGGGNGTILDLDQPEGIISCPNGTAIMPIRIHVQCQAPLIAADSDEMEILIAADRAAAYADDGTVTSETAYNMRTDNPRTSNCTCASAATADITDPTLGIELAHAVKVADVQGTAANALWASLELLYEPETPPVLMGPSAIYIYWGGTVATSGFAQVEWLEFAETAFS